jgi:uncharacterized membrane protein
MTAKAKIASIYMATLIGILLWVGAIFFAPYLKSQSSPLSGFIYAIFSATCHQIPSRCFYAFGYPLSVCARCFGIYIGFFLGTLVFPLTKNFSAPVLPKSKILILLSIPIAVDAAGNLLGIWTSSNAVRFLTGIVWGLILPFYFLVGLLDYILHKKKSGETVQNNLEMLIQK